MPRIIFVRPAETELLQRDWLLGRFDADLSEAGHIAARQLGEAMIIYQPTHLFTSPLKRAVSTAMAIEDMNTSLSARPVHPFQGMELGDWEKRSREVLMVSDTARFQTFLTDPDFPAPGGESIREVYARCFPELVNMVHYAEPYETLVFVVEDYVLKALCCGMLDLPLEHAQRFSMEPGAYSIFERLYEGGPYQLLAWNRLAELGIIEEEEEADIFAEEEDPVLG